MKKIINFLLFCVGLLNIVFPNSFQNLSISLLIITSLLIFTLKKRLYDYTIVAFWIILSLIFISFILLSNVSSPHKIELIFKYVVSPLLWITIISYIRSEFDIKTIMNWLIFFSFMGCVSVISLYIIMAAGFTSIVELIIINPNIDQGTGLGFTLHVYGSLVFFALAIFPSMKYISRNSYKYVYVLVFLIAAILSGRTALILSLIIGLLFSVIYLNKIRVKFTNIVSFIFFITIGGIFLFNKYNENFDVDFIDYITNLHFKKISDKGGHERAQQINEIVKYINDYPFGNGFISLSIIRDFARPFNFEVLILATIMRFGIITFMLILFSIGKCMSGIKIFRKDNESTDFFLLGFFGILMVSFTNPYLESFAFQWMFFIPLILLRKNFKYIN